MDLFGARAQVFIGVRAIRISHLFAEVLAVVARERRVGVSESEVFLGLGVERRAMPQRNDLAVFPLNLLIKVSQVNDIFLVCRGRKLKQKEVMALACGDFRGPAGVDVAGGDVVHTDIDIVVWPHCFAKTPSNHLSKPGTKWLHCRIFRLFCCARARSGNTKKGPAAVPTTPVAAIW